MALWCKDVPHVTVARSEIPRHVTIILPFYSNHEFFAEQVRRWCAWPYRVNCHVSAIVVDDGSPRPLARPTLQPFPIRVFRIHEDRRWNWLAARNIGFHHAADGWCLVTDMDHVIPPETIEALVYGVHRTDTVYVFQRREHTGEVVSPHSASFFMTRAMFWTIGGYDERGSGFYGNDGPYRRKLAEKAKLAQLPEFLERHEYVGDSSTTTYKRKQAEDAGLKHALSVGQPKVLSFAYDEVREAVTA